MNTEIVVSIIGLVGMVVVALISYAGNKAGAKKANSEATALFAYRLDQLEKKMDKHNNLIERMTRVEQRVSDLEKSQHAE